MPDTPTNSREFRKSEIARQVAQFNELLTYMRTTSSVAREDNEVAMHATAGMAAAFQMLAGMADDLSRIRELMQERVDRLR